MHSRRLFLQSLAAASLLPGKSSKPISGIFPIAHTPFTNDDKLDTRTLAAEVRFLDKAGVHGVVWPQLASEYFDLTMDERFAGMEVVAGTGKPLRSAVILGVQANDTTTALKYARHAEKLDPDALIALPPKGWTDKQKILEYYKTIGENCSRPIVAQTIGDMSVDFVIKMLDQVPNLHFLKDEAGESLPRISEFRKRRHANLHGMFTGNHGKTMIDELMRGTAGTMPASPFADLYVNVWDSWKAGDQDKALDQFSKVMLLVTQAMVYGLPGVKYLLQLRGVFQNTNVRKGSYNEAFDEEAKTALKKTLQFVKPFLRA